MPDLAMVELFRIFGPPGLYAVVLIWLLRREDDLQQKNVDALVEQRDTALNRLDGCVQRLEVAYSQIDEMRDTHYHEVYALRSALARAEGLTTAEIEIPEDL